MWRTRGSVTALLIQETVTEEIFTAPSTNISRGLDPQTLLSLPVENPPERPGTHPVPSSALLDTELQTEMKETVGTAGLTQPKLQPHPAHVASQPIRGADTAPRGRCGGADTA